MEDREHCFTLLAQKDWEAIGKIIYQKKAKVQDPYLTDDRLLRVRVLCLR